MATKHKVLKRISSVALVHIAAHTKMETGEVILAPNTTRENPQPQEKDYLLTIEDVIEAGLRARLVVLSCYYTARGEVTAEGVVGMTRDQNLCHTFPLFLTLVTRNPSLSETGRFFESVITN